MKNDLDIIPSPWDLDEKTKELLLLQEVNNLLNSGSKLEVILETIAKGLTTIFGYNVSAIHLLNESKTHLVCKSYSAESDLVKRVEKLTKISVLNWKIRLFTGSMLTQLIKTKEPIITTDILNLVKSHSDTPALSKLAGPIARFSGIKFGIGVPLLAEDKIVGVIGIGSKERLLEKDVEILLNFSKQAGLAVERAKIYEILEDTVQERTKELKESNEFLDSVFNSITDTIFIRDLNYTIIKANRVSEQTFSENLVGKCCFKVIMQRSEPCIDCDIDYTIEKKEAQTHEVYDDNLKEHLLISTYPIFHEDGSLNAVMKSIKIITEEKRTEEQMIRADKLASIGRLAAGFAHEINNPLTNISLYAQILHHKARGENRQMLDIVRSQTDVAGRIVKNFLKFSYPHSENYGPIQLNETLLKVLAFLKSQFRQGNVNVECDLDPELREIRGDGSHLEQVFVNILTNAIHSIDNDGHLKISTCNNGEQIKVAISDTGCGIPKEHLSKIFDPFFTTKEVGKGTGLGLFISYGIIQKHNGTIRVKSDIDKGTSFIIQFPKLEDYER